MPPDRFIATLKNNPLSERAGAQTHFDDLCDLLGVEKPRDPENCCIHTAFTGYPDQPRAISIDALEEESIRE